MDMRIEGVDAFARDIDETDRVAPELFKQRVNRAGMILVDAMKLRCPVDTSRLRKSLTHLVAVVNRCLIIGAAGTNVEYAPHTEFGARPHVIEARDARALYWKGADGEHRFARKVNHPGVKVGTVSAPRMLPSSGVARKMMPWMRPAFEAVKDKITATLNGAADELLGKMAGKRGRR